MAGVDRTVIPPPPTWTTLIQKQSSCPGEAKAELSSSAGPRAGEPDPSECWGASEEGRRPHPLSRGLWGGKAGKGPGTTIRTERSRTW